MTNRTGERKGLPREIIERLLGAPFADFGRGPESFDCYGIVLEGARAMGLELPDYGSVASHLYEEIGKKAEKRRAMFERVPFREARRGDVVAFNTRVLGLIDHMGLMVSRFDFLHTTWTTGGQICSLEHPVWGKMVEGIYRLKQKEE